MSLILLGLLLAVIRRVRRLGLGFATAMTVVTIGLGLLPVSTYLMVPLEERFPPFRDDGKAVDGIILLGGAVEASDSVSRGQLVVNESAERLLETIRLAQRYPQARIL